MRHLFVLCIASLVGCSSSSAAPSSVDAGAVDAPADSPADAGATSDATPDLDSAGGDTWTTYAAGFFSTYCTSCHDAHDTTGRDYTQQSKVEADRATIRCGVAVTQDPSWGCGASPVAKQFPIGSGPKPSDADRARLVAWISAGAP